MSDSSVGNRYLDSGEIFKAIEQALRMDGYVVLADALPEPVLSALILHQQSIGEREYTSAQVGRELERQRNSLVRSDRISWINSGCSQSDTWLAWIDELRCYLNQHLFLGLFSFESHFATYLPGDFYQRHLDSFHGASNRILSLIVYLNQDWQPRQGGELVIYHPETEAEVTRVFPDMGKLVLFLSEEFPHEVKPTLRTRHSVAGWFRINGSTVDKVDPPQ